MLDFELQTDASTTLQVWKMEEDLGQITAQTNLDTISGFGQLSYKRQKEKTFVNFLLQRELPKAHICYEKQYHFLFAKRKLISKYSDIY